MIKIVLSAVVKEPNRTRGVFLTHRCVKHQPTLLGGGLIQRGATLFICLGSNEGRLLKRSKAFQ